MKLQANHTTRYLYSDVVSTCHSEAHLTPRACLGQTVLDHRLSIDPEPDFSADRDDYLGNPVTMFSISQPHRGADHHVAVHGGSDAGRHAEIAAFPALGGSARNRREGACLGTTSKPRNSYSNHRW